MSRKTKEAVQGVIYILPSFVLILIFCIIPIFMSGYFSFTEYNIMNSPKFVGLDNYIKMFKDSYVTDAAKNTLLYVVMTVPVQTILALAFAAFLAAKIQNGVPRPTEILRCSPKLCRIALCYPCES